MSSVHSFLVLSALPALTMHASSARSVRFISRFASLRSVHSFLVLSALSALTMHASSARSVRFISRFASLRSVHSFLVLSALPMLAARVDLKIRSSGSAASLLGALHLLEFRLLHHYELRPLVRASRKFVVVKKRVPTGAEEAF